MLSYQTFAFHNVRKVATSSKALRYKSQISACVKNHFYYSDSRAVIESPIMRQFYNNPMNATKVGIIGGGIGGSALALALLNNNIPCLLFEKDASFISRKQGYGLTIQQGISALRKLGFQSLPGVKSLTHTSYNSNGKVLGCYGHGMKSDNLNIDDVPIDDERHKVNDNSYRDSKSNSNDPNHIIMTRLTASFLSEYGKDIDISVTGRHNIHISRQSLRQLLISRIPDSHILWDHQLRGYTDTYSNDGCILEFTNGHIYNCSILVAADGIHSYITKEKFPKLSLNYLNLIVILGISKNTNENCIGRIRQWLDGSTRVFTMPYDSTHTMWQLSFPCDEETAKRIASDASSLKAAAIEQCHGWPSDLTELLSVTEEGLVSGHPVYDRSPLSFSEVRGGTINEQSRVTFIGDSLHPMSPFKGQGANQALLDSILLANTLRNSELVHRSRRSISSALAIYEEEACRRSKVKVLRSRAAASSLHSSSALNVGNMTRASVADGYLNISA